MTSRSHATSVDLFSGPADATRKVEVRAPLVGLDPPRTRGSSVLPGADRGLADHTINVADGLAQRREAATR